MDKTANQTTAWQTAQLLSLADNTSSFTETELKVWSLDYIKGAIELIPPRIKNEQDLNEFKVKTETLLSELPKRDDKGKLKSKAYQKLIADYNSYIMKKFNMIPKGHHLAIWLPMGIALGIPFGLPLKNIAMGIPIGLAIGALIGTLLDKKAKKAGNVIQSSEMQ